MQSRCTSSGAGRSLLEGISLWSTKEETKLETELIHGELKPLNKRHIDLATTTKFNYQTGKYNGKTVQIANYYDKHNKLVAQKLRYPDKSFQWLGDSKQATLFGQNLWRDTNKKIVILEGEIDSMSMAQAQGLKWACVSVKTGSQGAKKDLQQQLEWLEQASEIVLMFDSDEAGLKAAWRALQISLKNVFDDRTVRFLFLPEGYDPDSFVKEKGNKEFYKKLERAMVLESFTFK